MPPRDGKPKRAHRKVCSFCVEKAQYIDYKEVSRLRRFISERGKTLISRPMIDHRGPEFAAMHREISAGVREVFGTSEADLLIISSSGTGSMESAVANLVSAGDKVVVCTCGVFGDRLADINAAYGAEVVKLAVDWGQPIEPGQLADVLSANPDAGVVFITHNETSTGVTNPLAALARVVRDAGRLAVVDAIRSG